MHRMTRERRYAELGALLVAAACSSGDSTTDTTAAKAADSAAPAAPAMFASAGATDSMKTPESVRYDADVDAFFISNINGNPSQKDGNGFIARVDAANTSAPATMFIEGGKNGVTLNAPKGMAIVGDTLWVADLDAVRAFNKRTGAPIASVDLRSKGAVFLNDVAAGPDGAIYITDTGVKFDASGAMTHPGPNQIFRLSGRTASLAIKSDSALKGPNGITWDAANSRFIVVPFDDKTVVAWKAGDSTVTPVVSGPGGYDGVEILADGRILVTSWADSAVHAISNGAITKVVANVEGPADIGIDTKRNVVAVPKFMAGKVEYFSIR